MHAALDNNFDLVTPIYDGLAILTFGGAIQRSQVSLLPLVRDVESAVVIGGGTGWFLLELLERTQVRRVVYIEKSESMLERSRRLIARKRPEWSSRVDFRLGTEDTLTAADGKFDLVVTNFFLACFGDDYCTYMIERLHGWLAPGGRWLCVDFEYPKDGWRLRAAQALFKVMFGFFNVFSSLEATRPPRYDIGFDKTRMRTEVDRRFHADMIRARLLVQG